MSPKIFVNIPTKNLEKATAFYEAIGFVKNPQFSDENASGLALGDAIHVMILTEGFFKWFLPTKEIADASKTCEVMNALSTDSKDAVNQFMGKVLANGGKEYREAYDHGFMYGRAFEDVDGHIWEIFWINVEAMPAKQ